MLQLRLPNIFKSIITQLLSLAVLVFILVSGVGVNAQAQTFQKSSVQQGNCKSSDYSGPVACLPTGISNNTVNWTMKTFGKGAHDPFGKECIEGTDLCRYKFMNVAAGKDTRITLTDKEISDNRLNKAWVYYSGCTVVKKDSSTSHDCSKATILEDITIKYINAKQGESASPTAEDLGASAKKDTEAKAKDLVFEGGYKIKYNKDNPTKEVTGECAEMPTKANTFICKYKVPDAVDSTKTSDSQRSDCPGDKSQKTANCGDSQTRGIDPTKVIKTAADIEANTASLGGRDADRKSTLKTDDPLGSVFSMLYKIVLMIVYILEIITQYLMMTVLLLLSTITATLMNLSPNAPYLVNVAVPLSGMFGNLANLVMGFLFIMTGSQAMMGLIKSEEAINRVVQLSIYAVVSNFVYLMLAFIVSVVDGFTQLIIKVFAGGNTYKLFYGLFSQFATISSVRKDGALFPNIGQAIGEGVGAAFSGAPGVFTNLVITEGIVIIMFMVMIWIFKDTFVLVLTRSTILLLFLITSPILALAYLAKDMMPSEIRNQVSSLPNQIFTAVSFNFTFIIAIVMCFRITQQAQEGFKAALGGGGLSAGPATGTPAKTTAFMDAFGGITGSADVGSQLESGTYGLMNTVAGIAPVFIGIAILYFVNDFYKKAYFPAVQAAASSVGKGISGGMKDFMQTKTAGERMALLGRGAYNAVTGVGTGQRSSDNFNLFKDGAGAAIKGGAVALSTTAGVARVATRIPSKLKEMNAKKFDQYATQTRAEKEKYINNLRSSGDTNVADRDQAQSDQTETKANWQAKSKDLNDWANSKGLKIDPNTGGLNVGLNTLSNEDRMQYDQLGAGVDLAQQAYDDSNSRYSTANAAIENYSKVKDYNAVIKNNQDNADTRNASATDSRQRLDKLFGAKRDSTGKVTETTGTKVGAIQPQTWSEKIIEGKIGGKTDARKNALKDQKSQYEAQIAKIQAQIDSSNNGTGTPSSQQLDNLEAQLSQAKANLSGVDAALNT